MSDSKTIQLPNGLAEEGDRIGKFDPSQGRWITGKLEFPERTSEFPTFVSDGGYEAILIPAEHSPYVLLCSPTDALEAVEEEELKHWGTEGYVGIAIDKFADQIRKNIKQKRKGHDQ